MLIPGPRLMRVRIADLCELLSPPIGTPLSDFEVYIDQVAGPKGDRTELTNWSGAWEVPEHGQDKVSVGITEPGIKVGSLSIDGDILYLLDIQDRVRLSDPLSRSPVATLGIPSDLAGSAYDLFFRPSPSSGTMASNTLMAVYDSRNGLIGSGVEFEGGLAFALDDLDPVNGPFAVRIQNPKEPIEGTVYLCSADAYDCFDYDPMRDLCGPECSEDGYQCCIDLETEERTCENIRSDDENCGACGVICEWDEICLKGTCVRGSGETCSDTECPSDLICCVDDWSWYPGCAGNGQGNSNGQGNGQGGGQGNGNSYGHYQGEGQDCGEEGDSEISCKTLMSDPKNCGWCGFVCNENELCYEGRCERKERTACSMDCPDGESCCYQNGNEKCKDLSGDRNYCGSCETECSEEEECVNGQCIPWYRANNPCEEGWRNCGFGEEIVCVNALNDSTNCGFCGNVCPSDVWCEQGQCTAEGKEFNVTD